MKKDQAAQALVQSITMLGEGHDTNSPDFLSLDCTVHLCSSLVFVTSTCTSPESSSTEVQSSWAATFTGSPCSTSLDAISRGSTPTAQHKTCYLVPVCLSQLLMLLRNGHAWPSLLMSDGSESDIKTE